jgi:hypothetical protein
MPIDLMRKLVQKTVKEGNASRRLLTNKEISEALVAEGHAPATSAAVSAWRKRHGYPPMREQAPGREDLIPWKVAQKDGRHRYYVCLLIVTRDRAGLPIAPKERAQMEKFVRELHDTAAVISYDRINGWRKRRPRPGIDIDLIRNPRLDDQGNPIEFDRAT